MRFLFVYDAIAGQVRDLLLELLVTDVHVIVARRGELQPRADEMQLLEAHPGSEAAACELNRKYRKNVQPYVTFTVEPKKFRAEDRLLREWLLGGGADSGDAPESEPKAAFERVENEAATLVVHSDGLALANNIDESRWAFASRAAELLGRLAEGDKTLGPLRDWDARHGVAFAANGRVSFRYEAVLDVGRVDESSEWHLKAGDRTTAEKAARIYFTVRVIEGKHLVLVAYVGPHPPDGSDTVDFGRIDLNPPQRTE